MGGNNRIDGLFYLDDSLSRVGQNSTDVEQVAKLERRKLKRAGSAPVKGKPQIEQRRYYHPVGDKAVSLMGAPSAMLRVVAAPTQSLQIS